MKKIKILRDRSVKLNNGRVMIIFEVSTSTVNSKKIINKINNCLRADCFANRLLDPSIPGVWWIRQEVNPSIQLEITKQIQCIIESI